MPRLVTTLALAAVVATLAGCAPSDATPSPTPLPVSVQVDSTSEALWTSTVEPYLQDDLWLDRDIYDAGHVLMAPLEAAFRGGVTEWQDAFAQHFARFVAAEQAGAVSTEAQWRLQYFALAAHFVNLAASYGRADIIPSGLTQFLQADLKAVWLDRNAWQWDSPDFHGMRERLVWRLDHPDVSPSYLRAVIDEELFALAIAADLRVFERATLAPASWSPTVSDVLDVAERVLRQESSYPGDGWLFQVGVWTDHPDYAYAGLDAPAPDMMPTPRPGVATDSSHAARWPVWITSLRDSSAPGSDRQELYSDILERMGNQVAEHILVLPTAGAPYLRMNNYMDGGNGLYRWNYETVPKGEGTEGFGLSGSLPVLWWGMLPDSRVNAAFCALGDSFPLPAEAVALYVGPNTTRDRNPLIAWPAYFENGFAELDVRLMCDLGRR